MPEQYFLLAVARFLMFVLLVLFVYLGAILLEKKLGKKRPAGVTALAVLLAAASLDKLAGFRSFEYYRFMFQQLPEAQIVLRYVFSITLRLIGLATAMGLLYLKEPFRKLAVGLGALALLTQPWKHPLPVFQNLSHAVQLQMPQGQPVNPWLGLVFYVAIDCIFALVLIVYLTRPQVKKAFRK